MPNTVPVRVNIPNPDKNAPQPRVVAVVDESGKTAHTATGKIVPIVNQAGLLKDDVIVHGGIPR
jgi:hypothetical protein